MASLRKKSRRYYARFYDANRSPKTKNASETTVQRRSEAFYSCRLVPEMGFV